ncbi:XisI protein [Oscillatoriales cyanobacterium LEGE 11467]|uniref:XisI protein n=1 Tax=Zarconia navalis LEGE 11467 TaxID=1828826 RepID=A0A928VZ59_9CYAN|nr:XisI protein [Zarconia navalis LEGE 11467]
MEKYREIVKSIIRKYSEDDGYDSEIETQTAIDIQSDRYMMFHIGWRGERRVFGCVIYIEIKGDKIWIQRDGIEDGIANALIEAGVPKSDIVLGYRSPYMRQFTELAVG